jgi:hypothetical protein
LQPHNPLCVQRSALQAVTASCPPPSSSQYPARTCPCLPSLSLVMLLLLSSSCATSGGPSEGGSTVATSSHAPLRSVSSTAASVAAMSVGDTKTAAVAAAGRGDEGAQEEAGGLA